MAETLEQRLDAVESRTAIADLVHTYARYIRYDQPDLIGTLFTADATFEIRDGHPDKPEFTRRDLYKDRADIHAHMAANKGNLHPVPLIHNLIVEVDGDHAIGNCVMEASIYGGTHKVFGEYRDTFRRENGKWLFASRVYTIFTGASSL